MQKSPSSFAERVIGAISPDPATYEEVEHDTDAAGQAALVVAVAAVFSGAGSSRGDTGVIGGVLAHWSSGPSCPVREVAGAYLSDGPPPRRRSRGVASPRLLLCAVAHRHPGIDSWHRVPVHIHRRNLVADRQRDRIATSARGEHRPRGRRCGRGVPGDVRRGGDHRGVWASDCRARSPDVAPGYSVRQATSGNVGNAETLAEVAGAHRSQR